MSRGAKVGYFFVALFTMVCLAGASIAMAEGIAWLATLLFVLDFFIIGAGFAFRKRFMNRNV